MKEDKVVLLQELHECYTELLNFLSKLNISQSMRQMININFDTGLLWAREAIISAPIKSSDEEAKQENLQ